MNVDRSGTSEDTYLRTDFLGRIAHELRGPAGVTLGALDELEHSLKDPPENLAPLLAMARRGLRRVFRIAERLERAGDLEAERVEWRREQVDLRETLQQAVQEAELLESKRGTTVVLSLPATRCVAWVDPSWMLLALTELVINAIAHAKRLVNVEAKVNDASVVVTVSDDGEGFAAPPPARFSRPRERRGLGLSLSIVRDVIQRHGGRLAVDLRDVAEEDGGGGACVRITLPRREHREQ